MTSSLVKKLGIREGSRLAIVDAPEHFVALLGELPIGVTVRRQARGPVDVIVAFFDSHARLERRLPVLRAALDPAGGLWIAWPKRASSVATDVTEGGVRALGLAEGLVDNKLRNRRDLVGASLRVPARRPFLIAHQRKVTRLLPRANPA